MILISENAQPWKAATIIQDSVNRVEEKKYYKEFEEE